MAVQDAATLKGYFNTGDAPTEAQFVDLIDSTLNSAPALDDVSDVTITTATTGDVLTYNGSGWVNDAIPDPDLSGLLTETTHDNLDHTGLTGVPAAYTLPTASVSVLGGVKVDGTSITITNSVISTSSLTNPMSAAGDIIYGGTAGAATRLAKGSDAQVLTLASGLPTWATPSGGSGSLLKTEISVPSNVDYVDITGLDSNTDGGYTITIEGVPHSAATGSVEMYVNEEYDPADYIGQILTVMNGAAADYEQAVPVIADFGGPGFGGTAEILIIRDYGGYAHLYGRSQFRETTYRGMGFYGVWCSTPCSNVTSCRIKANWTEGGRKIIAGTKIRVFKRK